MTSRTNQPDLFGGELDEPTPEQAGAEAARRRAVALAVERALGPGPVYQGVSREIRRLTATGAAFAQLEQLVNPDEHAGTIAAARALARTIDRMTGHNPSGWHASGRDVSPLLEELRALLERLHPQARATDAFEAWLTADDAPEPDYGAPAVPGLDP